MKSREVDGGACWDQWYRTRSAHLLAISGELPKMLCVDQLALTVCIRYVDKLLRNGRIKKYLAKYHPAELSGLQLIVNEFEEACGTNTPQITLPSSGQRKSRS